MDARRLLEIRRLGDLVEVLDEESMAGGVSTHLIDIRKGANGEVVIRGNREGLVHLARTCLSLAAEPSFGNHRHLDETGLVDHCDMPLVLVLTDMNWEQNKDGGDS